MVRRGAVPTREDQGAVVAQQLSGIEGLLRERDDIDIAVRRAGEEEVGLEPQHGVQREEDAPDQFPAALGRHRAPPGGTGATLRHRCGTVDCHGRSAL